MTEDRGQLTPEERARSPNSKRADRSVYSTWRGDLRRAREPRQGAGGRNRRVLARNGRDQEVRLTILLTKTPIIKLSNVSMSRFAITARLAASNALLQKRQLNWLVLIMIMLCRIF